MRHEYLGQYSKISRQKSVTLSGDCLAAPASRLRIVDVCHCRGRSHQAQSAGRPVGVPYVNYSARTRLTHPSESPDTPLCVAR